jgi:hypothetical protein
MTITSYEKEKYCLNCGRIDHLSEKWNEVLCIFCEDDIVSTKIQHLGGRYDHKNGVWESR